MLEVFTIGGGSFLVNIFNAVAAWSGGGGFRSMIQVVMVMGLIYALSCMAMNMDWRALFNWFVQSTLVYMMLIVPTVSIKVTDRINPSLPSATIDNVPLGLGVMASFTSQVGDWMTRQAETVFAMPNTLNLSSNGMVYGARLLEQAQTVTITNSEFRANLDEHIKQCVFYDVLLGHNSMNEMVRAPDLWTAMGPGATNRGQKWVDPRPSGSSSSSSASYVVTCNEAHADLTTAFNTYADADLTLFGKRVFPKLSESAALAKIKTDLPTVAAALHGGGYTGNATDYLRQQTAIDAFRAARESFSSAGWDSFAAKRADMQAKNTYTSIATQAMTWVPLLHIVLTAVFYAMFIVVFPLFLLPRTGLTTLKGYATGFFYLAAWGPLYAILHSFVMSRAANWIEAQAPSGPTLLVTDGMNAVNNDIATVAGFLLMSVPFLAAGMARGAMAIAGQATSMLAPAQHAAEAAAVERTTGNYSFGNTSFANNSANNYNANKWDSVPGFAHGHPTSTFQSAEGPRHTTFGAGNTAVDARGAMSHLSWSVSAGQAASWSLSKQEEAVQQELKSLSNAWSKSTTKSDSTFQSNTSADSRSNGTESSGGRQWGTERTGFTGNEVGMSAKSENRLSGETGLRTTDADTNREFDRSTDSGAWRLGVNGEVGKERKISDKVRLLGGLGGKASVGGGYNRTWENTDGTENAKTHTDERFTQRTEGKTDSTEAHAQANRGTRDSESDGTYGRDGVFARTDHTDTRSTGTEDRTTHSTDQTSRREQLESQLEAIRATRSRIDSGELQIRGDLTTAIASQYEQWRLENPNEAANYASAYDTNLSPAQETLRNQKIQELATAYATPALKAEIQSPPHAGPEVLTIPGAEGGTPSAPYYPGGDLPPPAPLYPSARGRRRENNDREHFNGRSEARRLGMGVKPGADIDNLHPSMRPVMQAVANASRDLGIDPRVITSGNDSKHNDGSAHYRDEGLDFRGNNISAAQGKRLEAEVRERLGEGYYVDFETFNDASNNHLHVQKRS